MTTIWEVYQEFSTRLSGRTCALAGGCVRDHLMQKTPKDFDLFVFGTTADEDSKLAVGELVKDLQVVTPLEFHKYEPYLLTTVKWQGAEVQLIGHPTATLPDLLDTFDWNVCRFGFGGDGFLALEETAEIARGKSLKLHRITFPLSTLRRGFRFSERFGMKFDKQDIKLLCEKILEANVSTGPQGAEPDMPSLQAAAGVA